MKRLFTPIYCAIIAFAVSLLALNAKAQAPITEYTFDNTLNNTADNTPFPGALTFAANRNQEANKALRLQSFDGRTVTIPSLPLGTADRTIALWYKVLTVRPANPYPSLFSYGEAATGKKFGFYLNGTGGIVHQGHGDDHTVNSVPTTLGDWYHLVVTFESQTVSVYINNVLRMQVARPTLNTGAGDFTIGGNFTGDIDDLSIYNRALSATEVATIYNDNPPVYWNISTPNIGVTQATVNYKITGGDNISSATIKYDNSPSALNVNMALSTGITPINNTVNLTGLTPNTTYYYQIEATNSHSTTQSQVYSFTTSTADVVADFPFDNYSLKDISGTMQFNGTESFEFDRNNEPNALNILGARTATIANLPVGNADRTVSVWFRINNYNNVNYPNIFNYGGINANEKFGAYLERNGTIGGSKVIFQVNNYDIQATAATSLNTWYHLVVTYQSGVMKMYLNNASTFSNVPISTANININTANSSVFTIGNTSLDGAMDDLKIFNRALTEREIRSLHTRNALPPNPAIITYTFNNTYSNVSGTAPFAPTSGTSFVADRYGNPNSALRIENIGTTATIPNLPYGKAERTIAIWVTRNTNAGIFDINNIYHYGTGSQGYGLTVTPTSMGAVTEAPTHGAIGMNNPLNVWDHLVISYDGITSKVYKNGVLLSAEARNWNTLNDGDIFRLGLTNNGTNYFFDGTVDDLMIYNYVLTDAEVTDLHNAILPVNLVSFTAKAQNNAAVLNWQTATETNNSHFTVKHSTNGVDFATLTNVTAKSTSGTSYQYTHSQPASGTNYYQLLQVDLDGKTNDLGVKVVNFGLPTSDIRLYPNPTTNQANVNFAQGTFHSAKLVNVNGQVLQTATIGKTQQTVTFGLGSHPNGVYFIQLQGNSQNSVQKVIKQ